MSAFQGGLTQILSSRLHAAPGSEELLDLLAPPIKVLMFFCFFKKNTKLPSFPSFPIQSYMVEGGVLERGEDTSSIGSAKEQTDAEGEAMEDFLKSKIGKGLTREDIKSITKKEGGWESKLIS